MSSQQTASFPRLPNMLRSPDGTGAYSFVLDLIINTAPAKSTEWTHILNHELGHYASIIDGLFNPLGLGAFESLRELISISHALISCLVEDPNSIVLPDMNCGVFSFHGPEACSSRHNEIVAHFLRLEAYIDQLMKHLEPIEEIAALLKPIKPCPQDSPRWVLQQEFLTKRQELLKIVLERYAIRGEQGQEIFSRLISLEDCELHYSIFRYCAQSAYFGINPLEELFDILYDPQYGNRSKTLFDDEYKKRIDSIKQSMKKIIEPLLGIAGEGAPYVYRMHRQIRNLMAAQVKASGDDGWVDHLFYFGRNIEGEYVVKVSDDVLRHVPESNWWRTFFLLETIRGMFKTGNPYSCPFQGWKVQSFSGQKIECGDDCPMKMYQAVMEYKDNLIGSGSKIRSITRYIPILDNLGRVHFFPDHVEVPFDGANSPE